MRTLLIAVVALPLGLLSACNRDNSNAGHGCGVAGQSALCGKTCTSDTDCGSGTYCGPDSTCTADCVSGGDQCGEGEACDPANGRCVGGNADFGTSGNPFDRDGACAVLSSQATLEKSPVDVILVVDNSGSMANEIKSVQNNINTNFAQIIETSGLDYRVIVVSKHGKVDPDESICIQAPLSGLADCTNPGTAPVNTAKFFQYSTEIGSHDSLDKILSTYNVADPSGKAPGGWSDWLRPNAFKTFIEITDDESTMVDTTFETMLFQLTPKNFGNAQKRNYVWHSIIGLKANTPPTTPWASTDPLQTDKCVAPPGDAAPPAVGTHYQNLSKTTGGLRYPICEYDNFDAVFKAVAAGVVASGAVACDFAVPAAPGGGTIDLNKVAVAYTPGSGGAVQYFKQAATSAACVPDAFYVENGRIFLCPNTCAALKADPTAKVEVLFVCESTIL